MTNPLLKAEMILWVGDDPRGGKYMLVYNPHKTTRGLCFTDSIESLKKLGLTVTPHWKPELARQGYYGVYNVEWRRIHDFPYQLSNPQIHSVVKSIYESGVTNETFVKLLKKNE